MIENKSIIILLHSIRAAVFCVVVTNHNTRAMQVDIVYCNYSYYKYWKAVQLDYIVMSTNQPSSRGGL